MLPSREGLAPLVAVGAPLVSNGGQYTRHAPEQALAPRLSFSKRYSVWPRLSTMIRPKALEPLATVATRADDPLEATAAPTPANARTARTVIPNTTVLSPFISGLL